MQQISVKQRFIENVLKQQIQEFMKITNLIVGLSMVLSLSSISCESDVLPNTFGFKYEQTKCGDPWGNDRKPATLQQAVIDYLTPKLISVLDSEIETSTGQACEACNCLTGSTILLKLSEGDGQKLLDLNEGWKVNEN